MAVAITTTLDIDEINAVLRVRQARFDSYPSVSNKEKLDEAREWNESHKEARKEAMADY